MSTPLVSVVLPVFNGERFIGEAIESVRGQTYDNLEIIVVDDQSTDGTATIVKSWDAVHYSYQENSGVSIARNHGVELSRGSLLAFLDVDDLWLPSKTALQVAYMSENPEVGLVLAHHRHLLSGIAELPGWVRPQTLDEPVKSFVPSSWMVRREALSTVGGFDGRFRFGQDTDWLLRAEFAGVRSYMLEDVLLLKRVHESNLTANVGQSQSDMLTILRESMQRRRQASAP